MRDTDISTADHRYPSSSSCTRSTPAPSGWRPGAFDHEKLDAFAVARDALALGDRLARRLPRGYANLADQLRRALLSAYLGIAEASSRTGADGLARFRCARGETAEAAAALDAVAVLGLASPVDVDAVVALLRRLAAMLTRLAKLPT